MFAHTGYRPLWPVIFLLPWLLLGIAYLVESILRRRSGAAALQRLHGTIRSAPRSSARADNDRLGKA